MMRIFNKNASKSHGPKQENTKGWDQKRSPPIYRIWVSEWEELNSKEMISGLRTPVAPPALLMGWASRGYKRQVQPFAGHTTCHLQVINFPRKTESFCWNWGKMLRGLLCKNVLELVRVEMASSIGANSAQKSGQEETTMTSRPRHGVSQHVETA